MVFATKFSQKKLNLVTLNQAQLGLHAGPSVGAPESHPSLHEKARLSAGFRRWDHSEERSHRQTRLPRYSQVVKDQKLCTNSARSGKKFKNLVTVKHVCHAIHRYKSDHTDFVQIPLDLARSLRIWSPSNHLVMLFTGSDQI